MDVQHCAGVCTHVPHSLKVASYLSQAASWPAAGRHVLAQATADTVVVYQAYAPSLGTAAAQLGRFQGVPGFSMERMTWVKTNFLWMMFRCGWASKPSQECVLAITLRRSFFERILALSRSTTSPSGQLADQESRRTSDVLVQWDPDHLPDGSKHPARRAVQLGLRGEVRDDFASGRQIVSIEDITPFVREMRERAASGSSAVPDWDKLLIPAEGVLELGESLRVHVGADKVANEAQNRR